MATGRQPREDRHVNDHLLKKQSKKTVQKDCGEAQQRKGGEPHNETNDGR